MENDVVKTKQKFTKKILKIIGSFISIAITGLVIATITMSVLGIKTNARIMGYSSFFIETFSMDSVYPAGSLIITKQNESDKYSLGDDISFYDSGKEGAVVTHRIVGVETDDQGYFYVTKGVENDDVDDNPVYYRNVIGKVVFSVPEIGMYIDYAKQNILILIGFSAGTYILLKQVQSIIKDKKNGDGYDEKDSEKE